MVSIRNLMSLSLFAMPLLVRGRFTSTFPNATTTIKGDSEVVLRWSYIPENNTADVFESQRALCDLMWGDSGYRVALLAQNVDPFDNELKVFVRADYGFNSSQYYIRYRSNDQKGMIYSDRFTLANMDGPDLSLATMSHGSGGVAAGASQAQASSSHHITSSTLSGSSAPTQRTSSLGVNSVLSGFPQVDQPVGPFVTLPSPTALSPTQTPTPEIKSNGASAMGLARQRDNAWKKASVLLWPVLVGAVMAM